MKNFIFPWTQKLIDNNLKVYLVGGCVRDQILDKEPKDLDYLILGATLDEIESLIFEFGKVDQVGKSFGVLKLQANDQEFDIAIPRKDKKIGNGHQAFVVDTKDVTLEEDLFRRDFTINSIALDVITGNIIDPYKGLEDLSSGLLKMTNPESFMEDALRMMRCVQFASRFNFKIEVKTLNSIKDNAHLIKQISGERITIELDKMFNKGNHELGFNLLIETGLLSEIYTYFPGYVDKDDLPRLDIFDQIKIRADFYFALFYSRPLDFFTNILKLDKVTLNHIKGLYQITDSGNKWKSVVEKRQLIFNIISKDKTFLNTGSKYLLSELSEFREGKYPKNLSELAINGNDLLAMGYEGENIKIMLNKALDLVFNDFHNNTRLLLRELSIPGLII